MDTLKSFDDSKPIPFYSELVTELKCRNIIRTKIVVGNLGEMFAIDYYTEN